MQAQEGRKYLTMYSTHVFMVIWQWTYGKGPFRDTY